MTNPVLLAISHGTASAAGQAAVEALVAAVAARLADVDVRLGHVDVQQPDVAASLAAIPAGAPVVVVPLLLSAGYHVHVDLTEALAERPGAVLAAALGPDERLAEVLATRLGEVPDAAAVVLAVAGSSDERANDDCRTTAGMLAGLLGRDVAVGFLAAADPRVGVAVESARSGGTDVVVANYLLAPGYFHDLAVRLAAPSPVARPLLDDDEPADALVSLVIDRYRDAAASVTALVAPSRETEDSRRDT